MFVTVLFIAEEQLRLFTLSKTGLSKQFCLGKLLQIGRIDPNNKILLEKEAKN